MNYFNLYDRISIIEKELRGREIEIPFGKEPDATIIANLHGSVAADLPGLISRVQKQITSEGRHVTQESFSSFEITVSNLLNKFPDMNHEYIEIINKIRDVYEDIFSFYKL